MARRYQGIRNTALAVVTAASLISLGRHDAALAVHAARAASPVGTVRYIINGLAVRPPQQPVRAGHMKEPLYDGYGLNTVAKERATVRFGDGTTVHMNQDTNVVLRSRNLTEVDRGQVAEYLKPGTNHQVMTAAALASAPGTTFGVKLQGNLSIFIVLRGKLRVGNEVGHVFVGSDQASIVQPHHKPGKPFHINAAEEFTWTDELPTPDLGQNIVLDSNGAKVLTHSSQRGGKWSVGHINDGSLSNGWESGNGKIIDQTIKLAFGAQQEYRISAIVIDPAATRGDPSSMDLKDFDILVSSTGTSETDFIPVLRGHCERRSRLQTFLLPIQVQARYIEIRARTNYGNPQRVAIAEMEVLAPTASFSGPSGVAVDVSGNVYVADSFNSRVVKLSPLGELLTSWGTRGTGPGQFTTPQDVAVSPNGDIYVLDFTNATVQEFSPDGALRDEWGGSGTGRGQLYYPQALTVDGQGNVYVADTSNNRIVKFSASGAVLATFGSRGTDPGQFVFPTSIAVDHEGNMYVVDQTRVQKLSPTGQPLSYPSVACQPPAGADPLPGGVAVDAADNVYIDDVRNHCLVKRSAAGDLLAQWAVPELYDKGFGTVTAPLAVDSHGTIYVLDSQRPTLNRLSPNGVLLEQWGQFGEVAHGIVGPQDLAVDNTGNVYVLDTDAGWIQKRAPNGRVLAIVGRKGLVGSTRAVLGQLTFPRGIAVDGSGHIYAITRDSDRFQIFTSRGPVRFFPSHAAVRNPYGVAIDHHGDFYVTQFDNVVKLSPSGVLLATLGTAGDPGSGPDQFNGASYVAVDSQDNVYIADYNNSRIKEYSPSGQLLAIWGSGQLKQPNGIAVDAQGNIYVTDIATGEIVKYSRAHVLLARWGGNGAGPNQLSSPYSIVVDRQGNIYVGDYLNNRVVKRAPDGRVIDIWE